MTQSKGYEKKQTDGVADRSMDLKRERERKRKRKTVRQTDRDRERRRDRKDSTPGQGHISEYRKLYAKSSKASDK